MKELQYFQNYPQVVIDQVESLITCGKLEEYLQRKYPEAHGITTDKLLYNYVNTIKSKYMSKAASISKVLYEKQKDLIQNALGTHSFVSRNHGGKLKSKHEIRISTILKKAPEEMLRMLVVHELAHFKEKDHNKAFYNLCEHMYEDYHQVELDLRLYLTYLDGGDVLYK